MHIHSLNLLYFNFYIVIFNKISNSAKLAILEWLKFFFCSYRSCSYHRKFSLLKFSVIFAKPKMPYMSIRQLCEVMDVKSLQEYPVMLEFLKAPLLVHQLSVWSGMRFVAAARELAAELESDLLWDTGTGSNLLILILEKLKKCNLIYETLQAVAESCLLFFF